MDICYCAVLRHSGNFQIEFYCLLITLHCMFLNVPVDHYFIYHASFRNSLFGCVVR